MIFQFTYQNVLDGTKTQTRRIIKPGQSMDSFGCIWRWKDPETQNAVISVYTLNKNYAVQPEHGKPTIARIRITNIRRQDVREIDAYDARAEGFATWMSFLDTWLLMHDKPMLSKWEHWIKRLEDRPAERYQAWALTFELVR